ncbi:MAG: molecular chaperone HtpG [Rhodospirillales bacterium]
MAKETFTFQAEVSKLLEIVAHSLYSQKDIFLRELISNASDACDRLRYAALTDASLAEGDAEYRITLSVDGKVATLTVSDNGIGMSRDELAEMLGTIARSGSRAFLDQLSGDDDKALDLIGQFGVGFYSAFMVARKVEVLSRRAGADEAWLWSSDGKGEYAIDAAERPARGTDVIVHLDKKEKEFLEPARIETIVKCYSDHIGIPIVLKDGDGERTLNTASALWTRDKKEITEDQYKEFYHHVGHGFDEPWMTLHNRVEGVLAYTNLLFIPSRRSFDLFHPDRKPQVKLYVKRVFITDDCEALLPPYLRFMRGIVDSEDLPLNISRDMFQVNPQLRKIKQGLVKRVLGALKKSAEKKPDEYARFWEIFGAVLKEGIYEDPDNRDALLALARFRSTAGDGLVSLDDYVGRMKENQDAIYTISGEDVAAALASPHLEGFKATGVEVLLMTDPVDDFWISSVDAYKEKPFKSATRGSADLDKIAADDTAGTKEKGGKDAEKPKDDAIEPLLAQFKVALGDAVKDVRASERLTDSPVCLVAEEGDMDIHLERLLKQHGRLEAAQLSPRVLEVNPGHPLIRGLAKRAKKGDGRDPVIGDAALLLLDQARIVDGEPVVDPQAFSRRLAAVMEKGFAAGA